MDIMDSTDTPTGGLDGTTASRGGDLPLSVDQRDAFASPTNASRGGGSVPTHASSSFSSSSSAFDRLDDVNRSARVDEDQPNALPTSTDDVMMPTTEYASHPSVLGSSASETDSLLPHQSSSSSSLKESAKEKASEAQAKASSLAEQAKSGMAHLKDSVAASLHSAEGKAEGAYHELKKDVSSHLPSSSSSASTAETPVRSTARAEATDTHPAAASMRDTHLHPGMVSLPTHENEDAPRSSSTHISAAHQAGLDAAARTEPKDPTASTGIMGALSSLHAKLEDGAERIKDKVDGWAESNLRSERGQGEHLSEAHVRDLPTLVDGSNERNTDKVRARLHPSGERAGGASQFDTEDVIDSI